MNKRSTELQAVKLEKRGCLLCQDKSEAKPALLRREGGLIAWEASTLPLSYTRIMFTFRFYA